MKGFQRKGRLTSALLLLLFVLMCGAAGYVIIEGWEFTGEIVTNPAASTKIETGDVLITVGTEDAISKLEDILAPD